MREEGPEMVAKQRMDADTLQWQQAGDSNDPDCIEFADLPDGGTAMRKASDPSNVKYYTAAEFDAFKGGVHDGEFDNLRKHPA